MPRDGSTRSRSRQGLRRIAVWSGAIRPDAAEWTWLWLPAADDLYRVARRPGPAAVAAPGCVMRLRGIASRTAPSQVWPEDARNGCRASPAPPG